MLIYLFHWWFLKWTFIIEDLNPEDLENSNVQIFFPLLIKPCFNSEV